MLFVESNLDDLATNLALDEALLEDAECGKCIDELLRIWLPQTNAVVVGRSSRVLEEVNVEQAERLGIPIYRRISGGAAVVIGPGCVAYSLILNYDQRPELRSIDMAHQFVMRKLRSAIRLLDSRVGLDGICDLVMDDRKVSGNSLRCRRTNLLYHGTILVDMDLQLIDSLLAHPPREPEYRKGRRHSQFLTNLQVPIGSVVAAIRDIWACDSDIRSIPAELTESILREKYRSRAWNFQR